MKQKYIVEIDDEGTTRYYNEKGQLHRLDGPAVINNGYIAWYQDGLKHRLDGPAWIWKDGTEEWFKDGKFHRLDGPASIWVDGSEVWYKDGLLHRLDGPAIIHSNGTESWYKDGKYYSKKEFLKITNKSKVPEYTMEQLVKKLGNFKLVHSEKKKKEKLSFHCFFSRNFTIL